MKYLLSLFVLMFFFTFTPLASAHVLITDHNMGALIHIDPDDDPIANAPSSIFIDFEDKAHTFQLQHCTCTATIVRDGKTVYSQPLVADSTDETSNSTYFSFTFPQKAIYTLKITGQPLDASFQPFKITYDIRVAREAKGQPAQTQNSLMTYLPEIVIAAAIFLFLLYVLIKTLRRKEVKP